MRPGRHRTVLLAMLGLLMPLAGCDDARRGDPSSGIQSASPSSGSTTPTLPTGAPTGGPSLPPATLVPTGSWAQVVATGQSPAAREDHTLTVTDDGTAYVFGGRDGPTVFGDLWQLDLATGGWRQRSPAGETPPARFGH